MFPLATCTLWAFTRLARFGSDRLCCFIGKRQYALACFQRQGRAELDLQRGVPHCWGTTGQEGKLWCQSPNLQSHAVAHTAASRTAHKMYLLISHLQTADPAVLPKCRLCRFAGRRGAAHGYGPCGTKDTSSAPSVTWFTVCPATASFMTLTVVLPAQPRNMSTLAPRDQ